MNSNKIRKIKDLEKLDPELRQELINRYRRSFQDHLIHYTDKEGKIIWALPFETEDTYYLIKMPVPAGTRSASEVDVDLDDSDESSSGDGDFGDLPDGDADYGEETDGDD